MERMERMEKLEGRTRNNPYALACLDRGWMILPLRVGGKEPAIRDGFHGASRDRARVTDCWAKHPNLNVGVVTGAESGIVVLDVDGARGRRALHRLERAHGRLPATLRVRTGRGGLHLYFEMPDRPVARRINREFGLDVLADDGYVVGPGSVVGGGVYRVVEDEPLAPIPDWLLGRMLSGCWDPASSPRAPLNTSCKEVMTTRTSTRPGGQSTEQC